MSAAEEELSTGAQSSPYTDLFGPWSSGEGVPFAYFCDPNTDNILMANCVGDVNVINAETEEVDCSGTWVTYRSEEDRATSFL